MIDVSVSKHASGLISTSTDQLSRSFPKRISYNISGNNPKAVFLRTKPTPKLKRSSAGEVLAIPA